jgi:hypothetical protein
VVQRVEGEEVSPVAATTQSPDLALDMLIRQVYAIVKQRLAWDRERAGLRRSPLGW